METRRIATPHYFATVEPALVAEAGAGATVNGPHPIADRGVEAMTALHAPIADFVAEAAAAGVRALSLAGDCCAAVPAVAGLQRADLAPKLVWVDAHGDFNTPETSPSGFLGGMPLAMLVGRGPRWMTEAVGARPLAEADVTLVDARDLDPPEAVALAASEVGRVEIDGLAALRLDGPVLLHVDLDVVDAAEAPAFNYPVPGGPSAAAVRDALAGFARANDVRCVSVSAWTPSRDADGRTARACRTALAPLLE